MHIFKKIITEIFSWIEMLVKIISVLLLLAMAKVTLRTNPEIAIPVLSSAALAFLIWYFFPQLKQAFNKLDL